MRLCFYNTYMKKENLSTSSYSSHNQNSPEAQSANTKHFKLISHISTMQS